MLLFFLLSVLPLAAAPPQDPVEFGRLATEQRQVADQLRRLDQILELLEKQDRQDGRLERADLIAKARQSLGSAEGSTHLAAVVEGVARELAALHSGNALSGQAELIQTLQDLLDVLVETERQERLLAQEKALSQRIEALREFRARQQELLEQTEALQQQAKGDAQEEEASATEQQEALREALAEQQNRLAEDLKKFNQAQEQESGRKSEAAEKAQEAGKQAAEKMRSQSAEDQAQELSQQLEEAKKKQQEALDALDQAEQQAQQQKQRSEESKRREALLNVVREAQKILDRHQSLEQEMQKLAEENHGSRMPRSARSRLRQISLAEKELALATNQLMLTIDTAGADSFPLYIQGLQQDHDILARELGPPRYQLKERALGLAAGLTADWQQLIDVIRVEQERIRKRLDMPPGGGGGEEEDKKQRPLVDFAMELQLLKRMQTGLAERLDALHLRLQAYAAAGLELGPEESN